MMFVPEKFRPHIKVEYPKNNFTIFEEWFFDHAVDADRIYLPIFFTSYQVNHSYGKDHKSMRDLQEFVDSIDRSKKYYLPCQYDDGPLVDFKDLDVKVFGSGGGRIDFPIPLVTMPHPYTFDRRRDIFCSFAGGMTHPIRTEIVRRYSGKYVIPKKTIPIDEYCGLMARSTFALCPRGYGKSSFRICEALQYGAIPVYISDDFIVPGNQYFGEYGITLHSDAVRTLDRVLHELPIEMIESLQEAGKRVYKDLFSYEGCKKLILDNL